MIKLTIDPDDAAKEVSFDRKTILIGNFSEDADLYLPENTLSPARLEISEECGNYTATNLANDPFTTLNGVPFGRKQIKDKDTLEIGDTVLIFETQENEVEKAHQAASSFKNLLDTEVKMTPFLEKNLKEDTKKAPVKIEDDIEDLFRLVEELDKQKKQAPLSLPSPVKEEPMPEPLTTKFPFESISFEEENPPASEQTAPSIPPSVSLASNLGFKVVLIGLIIMLFIGVTGMSITYYRFSGKIIEEEKKASGAIADVTMALTYAKIYNIKPRKQNWSSPEFLYNNLQAVLSPRYLSMLAINSHRQIVDTSYFLRIYTNSDQSRFLVIAQPAHSFTQWWIPKSAIVVDTDGMVMRRIDDLRALNRLLTTPQPLDGRNGESVFALIKEGEPIHLASLATRKDSRGFAPPKALAMIRPGAENLIYNAPRYSPLSEAIINKALSLIENPGTETDVSMLLDDLKSLKKFHDMVFYSSRGMQQAIQAQRALKTFIPKNKFLIAYLKYNIKGHEVSSNLLMSDENAIPLPKNSPKEKAIKGTAPNKKGDLGQIVGKLPMPRSSSTQTQIPVKEQSAKQEIPVAKREEISSRFTTKFDESPENKHPLYLRLLNLRSKRERALQPLSKEMHALINNYNREVTSDFTQQFRKRLDEYEAIDKQQQKNILVDVKALYHDYSDVPLEKVMEYIGLAGLDALVHESLRKSQDQLGDAILEKADVDKQVQKISDSQYLEELEHHVNETAKMLVVGRLPIPEKLIAYQGLVRAKVQEKLENFLLKPTTKLPPEAFHPEAEGILMNILHLAWVFNPDEFDFYLKEFDFLRNLYTDQNDD